MGISLDHSHHLRHVAGNEAEQMLARVSTAVLNGDANRGGLAERPSGGTGHAGRR